MKQAFNTMRVLQQPINLLCILAETGNFWYTTLAAQQEKDSPKILPISESVPVRSLR